MWRVDNHWNRLIHFFLTLVLNGMNPIKWTLQHYFVLGTLILVKLLHRFHTTIASKTKYSTSYVFQLVSPCPCCMCVFVHVCVSVSGAHMLRHDTERLILKLGKGIRVVYRVSTVLTMLPHCLPFHLLSLSRHYWRPLAYLYVQWRESGSYGACEAIHWN